VTEEKQESPDQAQSLDNLVLHLVLAALGQRAVDYVTVVRLQADVQVSQQSQDLIEDIGTVGIIKAASQEEVLDGLEELHGEEEEHSRSKLHVVSPDHDEMIKEVHT
jgi:hypothetical protein